LLLDGQHRSAGLKEIAFSRQRRGGSSLNAGI